MAVSNSKTLGNKGKDKDVPENPNEPTHEFHPVNVTELHEWIKRELGERDDALRAAGLGGPVSDADAAIDAEADQLEKAAKALEDAKENRAKRNAPVLPKTDDKK